MNNDILKDLLMFYSSKEKKRITLKEYVENMKEDQEKIYYASSEICRYVTGKICH